MLRSYFESEMIKKQTICSEGFNTGSLIFRIVFSEISVDALIVTGAERRWSNRFNGWVFQFRNSNKCFGRRVRNEKESYHNLVYLFPVFD
jgi:hypothetical protein